MSHDLSAHFGVSDARDVVWAHAVNSRSDLDEALRDTRVHMLEADLVLAAAPRDDGAVEPAVPTASDVLMCHPPRRSSDLTFEGFAREVLAAVRRGRVLGVKLDFKEADAVAPCLELLRLCGLAGDDADAPDDAVRAVPVWLNADVVRGPGGRDPIPAERFVRECARACPRATLSLGWTPTGRPYSDTPQAWRERCSNSYDTSRSTSPSPRRPRTSSPAPRDPARRSSRRRRPLDPRRLTSRFLEVSRFGVQRRGRCGDGCAPNSRPRERTSTSRSVRARSGR